MHKPPILNLYLSIRNSLSICFTVKIQVYWFESMEYDHWPSLFVSYLNELVELQKLLPVTVSCQFTSTFAVLQHPCAYCYSSLGPIVPACWISVVEMVIIILIIITFPGWRVAIGTSGAGMWLINWSRLSYHDILQIGQFSDLKQNILFKKLFRSQTSRELLDWWWNV